MNQVLDRPSFGTSILPAHPHPRRDRASLRASRHRAGLASQRAALTGDRSRAGGRVPGRSGVNLAGGTRRPLTAIRPQRAGGVTRRAGAPAEDGAAVDGPGVRRLSGLFWGRCCHHGNSHSAAPAPEYGPEPGTGRRATLIWATSSTSVAFVRCVRPSIGLSSEAPSLASPAGDNFVRSDDSSGKTVVAPATGTTAPPRPEATSPAKPPPRTGNAGRPGRPASFADDTRSAATAVRRISRQRTARKERGNATRSPASRTQARGSGGSKGEATPPRQIPLVRTRGRLAMTHNRCHGQLCARAVFSPRPPLPCALAGRCAGVIDVARALRFLLSAAVTGRLFPGVTRSPLSVVLAALSPMRRAAWSRSCPCRLPACSVRFSSRSLVSVDPCCSSRSIGSCT